MAVGRWRGRGDGADGRMLRRLVLVVGGGRDHDRSDHHDRSDDDRHHRRSVDIDDIDDLELGREPRRG